MRLFPEFPFRRLGIADQVAPDARKNVIQLQHGHIAANAVAMPGNRAKVGNLSRAHLKVEVVELARRLSTAGSKDPCRTLCRRHLSAFPHGKSSQDRPRNPSACPGRKTQGVPASTDDRAPCGSQRNPETARFREPAASPARGPESSQVPMRGSGTYCFTEYGEPITSFGVHPGRACS